MNSLDLFPGVLPSAPAPKARGTLRARPTPTSGVAANTGRLTFADLEREAAKRRTRDAASATAASAVAASACAAEGCGESRSVDYAFCLTHQAMLPPSLQVREVEARGTAGHAAALAWCRRIVARREGRVLPGEVSPWADPPDVAERVARVLAAAGMRRRADGKGLEVDVSTYDEGLATQSAETRTRLAELHPGEACYGARRVPLSWADVSPEARVRLSWLSADVSKCRTVLPEVEHAQGGGDPRGRPVGVPAMHAGEDVFTPPADDTSGRVVSAGSLSVAACRLLTAVAAGLAQAADAGARARFLADLGEERPAAEPDPRTRHPEAFGVEVGCSLMVPKGTWGGKRKRARKAVTT